MTALTLWLHAHGPMAVALALFVGGFAGVLVTCILVSGRDPLQMMEDDARREAREAQRAIDEWMRARRNA